MHELDSKSKSCDDDRIDDSRHDRRIVRRPTSRDSVRKDGLRKHETAQKNKKYSCINCVRQCSS